MKHINAPAFPHHGTADYYTTEKYKEHSDDPRNGILQGGMTLLDYFAGQCLLDISQRPYSVNNTPTDIAKACYDQAEAMLVERTKRL